MKINELGEDLSGPAWAQSFRMKKQYEADWPSNPTEAALETAFQAALKHSDSCTKCAMPIVQDDEGNPGYRGEACAEGVKLLDTWNAAMAKALGR